MDILTPKAELWTPGKRRGHLRADVRFYHAGESEPFREDLGLTNVWHDEGELYLLSLAFATGYANYGSPTVANLYLGLDNRAALAEADTLATLVNENPATPLPGVGYARIALSTAGTGAGGQDFVVSQPAAAYRVTSKSCVFTAGGVWLEIRNLFLCTHITALAPAAGQRLIGSLLLSHGAQTLTLGDTVTATFYAGISE